MAVVMEIVIGDQGRAATQAGVSLSIPIYEGEPRMRILAPGAQYSQTAELSIDPNIRGGVPCVGASHWPIAHILESLASGTTVEQLVRNYPGLTLAEIQLALRAAAWVMRDPAIDWQSLDLPDMLEFQQEMQAWQGLTDDSLGHADEY